MSNNEKLETIIYLAVALSVVFVINECSNEVPLPGRNFMRTFV